METDPQTILALHCLKAPLDPNPITDLDKFVNSLRVAYRTLTLEFRVTDGALMLPTSFVADFGAQLGDFATFIDPNNNQFDIMVERIGGVVFLTTGFNAIHDFYNVWLGGTIVMVFTGKGQFGINILDRSGRVVTPPFFIPPMKFEIEKTILPPFVYQGVPVTSEILSFHHDERNFSISWEKVLTGYDIRSGFLMLIYKGFCDVTIGKKTTSLILLDGCGNKWHCITIFGSRPHHHIKLGGGWKRMVLARRLEEGVMVKVGFRNAGRNDTIYIEVKRPAVPQVLVM